MFTACFTITRSSAPLLQQQQQDRSRHDMDDGRTNGFFKWLSKSRPMGKVWRHQS